MLLFKLHGLNETDLIEFTSFEYLAIELKAELSLLIPPIYSSLFLQGFSELNSLTLSQVLLDVKEESNMET